MFQLVDNHRPLITLIWLIISLAGINAALGIVVIRILPARHLAGCGCLGTGAPGDIRFESFGYYQADNYNYPFKSYSYVRSGKKESNADSQSNLKNGSDDESDYDDTIFLLKSQVKIHNSDKYAKAEPQPAVHQKSRAHS